MAERMYTPGGRLAGFVSCIWYTDAYVPTTSRERILPTGHSAIVLNLDHHPFHVFDGLNSHQARALGEVVVAGVRPGYLVLESTSRATTMGVVLRPGAATALLGVPATCLKATNAALGDILDEDTAAWIQTLRHIPGVDARIRWLEAQLTHRLVSGVQPSPVVTAAVAAWDAHHGRPSVAEIVERTGYSHRRFTDLFRDAVGLPPKTYARVRRFQHAIGRIRESDCSDWSRLALAYGYCDQAHLIQEFREFTGMTPAAYATARLPERNHIPT